MPQESFEDRLKNIRSWHFIPGKNKILPVLESILNKDEYIVDVIDGFFPEKSGAKGQNGDSGLILVTDRTVVLIRSEFPEKYIALKKEKIISINCHKSFSALTVIIDSGRDQYSFVTQLSEFAVKNIFSAAGKPVEREGTGIRDSIISNSGSSEPAVFFDAHSEPSVSELLYPEIRKIHSRLNEFRSVIPGRNFMDMFRDDIYTITYLCGMNGRELSDNEMLFICMTLSAGEDNDSGDPVDFIDEVMKYDSFPVHLRDTVNRRMELILSGISRVDIEEEIKLKSMDYLAGYDLEHGTKYADKMAALLYEYSQCLLKADGTIDGSEEEKLKKISELIHKPKHSEIRNTEKPEERPETIEELMEIINALVGMDNIKDEIKSFINFINVRKEREKLKLPVTPLSLHAVFYGPPGTGKTTIARLLGRVYRALGLLQSGHLVETDRSGLVAGFVGQTAIKTDEQINKAKDGVLFIDEAYTLVPENSSNDFGRESVDTILKRMEDMREGFAVIAAGYTDEMERFINSNPGLKSRFSRYFNFNHYTPEELFRIFNIFADNVEFKLTGEADIKLKELIGYFYERRNRSFGNARFVRNLFDRIVQNQADRLASVSGLTRESLCEVTADDIPVREDFTAEQFSGSPGY